MRKTRQDALQIKRVFLLHATEIARVCVCVCILQYVMFSQNQTAIQSFIGLNRRRN